MKQKLILLALVMGLTIVSQSSLSLGMGKIQVYSALNESLQSSIDLLANADEELLNLEVKLASSEDYQKVGLDKSFVPANIMVAFDEENPYQINVTSNGPVSEPIVSLLLDVNWNNGRILREFTVLLDPPVYESINSSAQVNNVVVEPILDNTITEPVEDELEVVDSEPELQAREEETRTITNEDFAEYEDQATEAETADDVIEDSAVYSSSSTGEVYVEAGDTLWRIANNNKLGDLSAQQMMMAIYNKNPNAFIDNNINKLIKGSRLDMPSNDEVNNIGFSEALAQVESHHQSWSPAQQDYNTYQTEETTDTDYQEPVSTLDYGVQLSGGDNQGSDDGQSNADEGTAADAQAIEEDLYNKDAENTDLKERISELEDIVEQQQDVIEISDDGLANLENQLDNAADDTEAAADDIWDEVSETDDSVVDGTEDDLSLNIDVVDSVDDVDADSDNLQAGDFDSAIDSEIDEITNDTDANDTVLMIDDTVAVDQANNETAVETPRKAASVKQESLVDQTINWVMDNLMWVLIGLVALIVLLFLPKVLRGSSRNDDEEDHETSFLDDIKNRKKVAEEEDIDAVETKMNQPLVDDSDDDDSEDDVLAELDRSIDFDNSNVDDTDAVAGDIEDEFTELNEEGEFEVVEEDGFDLDGFLNDDGDDDITTTKDHSATLADVSFDDDEDEVVETDLGLDLDDEDDVSFEDLDLDDEIEELSDDVDEAVEDFKTDVDDAVKEVKEVKEDAAKATEESDEFSFDDDEDFDFDLDEELEELEQTEDVKVADEDNDDGAESEEFNDMLDISDESTETFEIIDEEAGMDEEIDLGLEDLMDDTDAIDTKLDLAKAYIDMGDAEGAKNLLDEIYSEGTEEQIAAAKKLLDDM